MSIRNIFLAGGGSEEDSYLIDRKFADVIDTSRSLIYIPNAMRSRPYNKCLEWITGVFSTLGIEKIEMWQDLTPRYSEINAIGGVYIGGGDTSKLAEELRTSGFDKYLREVVERGVPVYGGSAGAIILGKDLRTAPEAVGLKIDKAEGLDVVSGYSVMCHFDASKKKMASDLVEKLGLDVIAIPEKSGVFFNGVMFVNYGKESVDFFKRGLTFKLSPGQKINLDSIN
jgi:dipeptidase E